LGGLHTVDINGDGGSDHAGCEHISIVHGDTGAGVPAAYIREIPHGSVPPNYLKISRGIAARAPIDFVARAAVWRDRTSEPNLQFLEDRIVLIDGLDDHLDRLVWAPRPREERNGVVVHEGIRAGLHADRKARSGGEIGPV